MSVKPGTAHSDPRLKELNQYSTQLIRELIIPKLTKEINRAKRYAGLRQVFYSLVLSRWFKDKFNQPQSGNELTKLIDSGNLSSLSSKEAWDKTTYFKAYQESFKEGEYSLSESVYTPTGQVIRRYMSGGTEFTSSALTVKDRYNAVSVGKIPYGANGVSLNYPSGGNPTAIVAASALTLRDELKSALLIKQAELAALGKIAYSHKVIDPISQLIIEAISGLEAKWGEELTIGNIKKLIKNINAKIKKDLLQGTMDEQDQLVIIEKLNSLIEDRHILTRIFEQEKPALTKIGGFIMKNIKIIPKGNIALTPAIEISDKVTFKEIYFQHPYFTGYEVKDNVSICFYERENQDTPSLRLTLFIDGDIEVYGETGIMDFIYGSTLSEAYGKGDVRNFFTTMINRLKQQLTQIIVDGIRNNDYPESDAAKLIKGIGEILGLEVTGMIDLVIAELSDEQEINKLKSLKKSLSAGAVSPGESLNLKALRMLSEYLDDEMYRQVSPYITNARGIGELKEKFDNIVEALKNKAKWATAKAFDPGELNEFSDTLSVLVIVEKMDKILEEKHRHIKMMAQTYASLSKKQQLKDLDVVLEDLKKAGAEIESLSLQLEEARARIVSSALLTKSDVIKIINDFIQALNNQAAPNENFLKRIELTKSNEEIRFLLERLIRNNDSFMDVWEELQKQISEPLEIDHLSPTQFYDQLKNMFENAILGKVLVIGAKNDSYLTATVKSVGGI